MAQVTPLSGTASRRGSFTYESQRLGTTREWVSSGWYATKSGPRDLSRAIVATVTGDTAQLHDLFTLDVLASGPNLQASSRDQLAAEIERARRARSRIARSLSRPLDVSGDQACVEWVASGVHSDDYA